MCNYLDTDESLMAVVGEAGAIPVLAKLIKLPVASGHDIRARRVSVHCIQVTRETEKCKALIGFRRSSRSTNTIC